MTYHCVHCNKNVVFTTSDLIDRINELDEAILYICTNTSFDPMYDELNKKRKREEYEESNNAEIVVYKKIKI
jgi:hypothetical protein